MLTTELEERLKNPGCFDESLIENNAPPELSDVLGKYIDEKKISRADIIRRLRLPTGITVFAKIITKNIPRKRKLWSTD